MLSICILAASLTLPVCEAVERPDQETKSLPGVVKSIARVDIVPQVCGEILETGFQDGAPVRKGDVLYRLDSVRYVAAVKNAEAAVAKCTAELAYAERSYERHGKLVRTRAVSQDAYEDALAQKECARANLEAARAELAVAQDRLRHCTIVAPFSGQMGTAVRKLGSYVMDDPDTWPLVDLVQTDPIRVRFAVANGDYLRMFDGQLENLRSNAVMEVFLPDGRLYDRPGRIEYIENVANRRTDTTTVYVQFDNPEGLLRVDGTVGVRLSSACGTPRLAVPVTAVLQNVQGPYVWIVAKDGTVERRPVGRGRIDGAWQFIEKGLERGERVVADGAHRVKKGMTVVPARENVK